MAWTAREDTDPSRTADLPSPLWEVLDEHGDLVAGGFTEEQARLCAAAPDLQAALQGLYDAMRNGANLERYYDNEIDELWSATKAALDKADLSS